FTLERLGEPGLVEMIGQLPVAEFFGAEAVKPCKRAFESFQFGHLIGKKVPIIRGGILPEEISHQAVDQPRHAIPQSGDCSAREPETRHRSVREVMQPAEEWSGSGLA